MEACCRTRCKITNQFVFAVLLFIIAYTNLLIIIRMVKIYARLLFLFSFVALSYGSFAQVVINEFSCSNLSQFYDNYQKHEDWFELYNTGGISMPLGGYYLSDDTANRMKWQIPS